MADDTKVQETTTVEQPQPIKLGDKEYTQDELSKLVGLGEIAREFETKWNRPISEFYPDYTRKSQELADLKREREEESKRALEEKSRSGQELSAEEARELALQEAKRLGIVTRDEFSTEVNKAVSDVLAARDLISDVEAVISKAEEEGKPKTTTTDLLKYMEETGFKNPEKAYKDMFESELEQWKEKKLKEIKPAGMETQETTNAGGKQPPAPSTLTKDTLGQAIRDALTRGHGVS